LHGAGENPKDGKRRARFARPVTPPSDQPASIGSAPPPPANPTAAAVAVAVRGRRRRRRRRGGNRIELLGVLVLSESVKDCTVVDPADHV